MKRIVLVTLLFAVRAAAHTITGTVEGPDGPVSGAKVVFHYESNPGAAGHTTITDASGRFSGPAPQEILFLEAVPPASRNLSTFYDGIGLTITRDMTVRIRLVALVRITGQIRDAEGRAVAGTVDLFSLTGALNTEHSRQTTGISADAPSGSFSLENVPGDFYSIHARAAGRQFAAGRLNVDARRNATGLRVTLGPSEGDLMPRAAPRRDRITVGATDAHFLSDVTGAAGAVEPLSAVTAINMMTGQTSSTVSDANGGFSLRLGAGTGATISVQHDPTGWYLPVGPHNATGVPAVFLHIPPQPGDLGASSLIDPVLEDARAAATLNTFGAIDGGQWIVRGALADRTWEKGERLSLQGTVVVQSRNLGTDISGLRVSGFLALTRRFDAGGAQRAQDETFFATTMTPTGFPLERDTDDAVLQELTITNLRSVDPGRAEADWSLETTVPDFPAGTYQTLVNVHVEGMPAGGRFLDAPVSLGGSVFTANGLGPLVTIGDPPPARLFFALGINDFDNGVRGTIAVEDRGKYQLASHVLMQPDTFVLPLRDERTGAPIRHRLEPFLPALGGFDSLRIPSQIAFVFPSGSLRVRVHRPDGTIDDLGSAPFQQLQNRFALTRNGLRINLGTAGFPAMYELTTLDPRFEYAFSQSGPHRIEMTGTISDVWGRSYEGGGTFEVIAGRPLDIDPGVMVGTPLQVGNLFTPALTLTPPVPADIEMRVRHLPGSDPVKATEQVVRGRANRFGHFAAPGFTLGGAGEFRVDVKATYVDESGLTWAGQVVWGSVVETPSSPIIAHGRRGFDTAPQIGQTWFGFRDDGQQPGDHVMYPFHGGDVMWMEDSDRFSGIADTPIVSMQDTAGDFAARVRERSSFGPLLGSPIPIEERIAAGEIPLFSSARNPAARHGFVAPDQWGYAYLYAERPSIRVREMVSEDFTPASYWRFRDNYHFQLGNGINGDLTNDFKFQFGGAVYRDETDGFRWYGAYGSFFVLIPERDPTGGRIMPPFRGNGGGPDGGPLLTLKGREIDLFFHPTALRPGTILDLYDHVSVAGYSAPTLPSRVEIVVTSPTGVERRIAGRASKIGYFHLPLTDFVVTEPGIWRARVSIVFDGQISAGQVTEPFPSGDVLGSRGGEFFFYVVDRRSPQLELKPLPQFVRPADGSIRFDVRPPAGLTDAELAYTVTMPGFILDEGTTRSMRYTYDARELAADFPNLDLEDPDGFAGMDTITISLLLSGTDSAGKRLHLARQFVIQGEEIQMPPQTPGQQKRRSVRK